MIIAEHLQGLLKALNFSGSGSVWTKTFSDNAQLQVDFTQKKLIYPEDKGLKINERQTCNFSSPENFVVFECVHRLLEKEYIPQHLE